MNRNIVIKKIAEIKKSDKTAKCDDLMQEKATIEKNIEDNGKEMDKLWKELTDKYSKVGNLVHESVPVHNDE